MSQTSRSHRHKSSAVLVRRSYLTSQNYREAIFNNEIHQKKIAQVKPTLNTWNDSHIRYGVMERNNRRINRVKEAREQEIKRLNEILVGRITQTVMSPSRVYGNDPVTNKSKKPGKRPHTHRTLNYHTRKKEQAKIAEENLQIAKRILSKKPFMEKSVFEEHTKQYKKHKDTLSQFVKIPKEQYDALKSKVHHPGHRDSRSSLTSTSVPMRQSQAKRYEKILELTATDHNMHKPRGEGLLVPVRQAEANKAHKADKKRGRRGDRHLNAEERQALEDEKNEQHKENEKEHHDNRDNNHKHTSDNNNDNVNENDNNVNKKEEQVEEKKEEQPESEMVNAVY